MGRTGTILLVEDNRDDEALAMWALRKHQRAGDVTVARDGAEAIDYLLAQGCYAGAGARPLPDLVLLDLNLPKVSGLEVLRTVRSHARTRLLPIVVLSSSAAEGEVAQSYALGANSYVQKPVSLERFSEVIDLLGRYWLVLNEPFAGAAR